MNELTDMRDLPIYATLPELRARLAAHSAVVLMAPPGAGKTTGVPPVLLDEPWLQGRTILILEPRRLAARAACARMAHMLGDEVGGLVGYRIRFETRVSKRTRIEVLTEGILTRRLQTDPSLDGVGLVIFDEFHERHLHADLALALVRDSQRLLRPDLKLLMMSATLDDAACARLLDAPLVTSIGRSFPVEIDYAVRDPDGPLAETVSQAVARALDAHAGDVLVFLPGAAEIRRTHALLTRRLGDAVEIHLLYGDLPWEQQDRALQPGERRKVVLATPIAETSLTIEGVGIVIDSGYARAPQFDPRTGLTRLVTQRVARASADQRAGRAGRLGPGVCYRLWSEMTQRGLVPHPAPEIRTADLAPLALELAAWGTPAEKLDWLDPPPLPALAQARDLLTQLDALDAGGAITDVGRAMATLPLHPRLAHMVRAAEGLRIADLACDVAALLSERDIVTDGARSWDLGVRLDALAAFRRQGRQGATAHGVDPHRCAQIERAARQWRRIVDVRASDVTPDQALLGVVLTLAYPDRVAQRRAPDDLRYLLANGRGARLRASAMSPPPYLVAASLDAGAGEAIIYLAASVTLDALRAQRASHIATQDIVRWDDTTEAVVAQREERLGVLVLGAAPLIDADPEKPRAAMLDGIRRLGIGALPWTPAARAWQARVLSLRHWCPDEDWPDVSDAALLATLDDWLAPYLDGIVRRAHLARLDLTEILKNMLDYERRRRLDQGAPIQIEVPSGSRVRLEYVPGQSPVLAVKLQELFGLADTPRVAWGRIPVTLHLLSPARRPIQVTQDLRGFWERTYAEVKKELKGRYPKHPWPDDPWSATPTARAKRKSDSRNSG